MMTIDLKWALPFVVPFVLLGMARVMWWVAGAPWTDPEVAAAICLAAGGLIGAALVTGFSIEEIHWRVTIGRKDSDDEV